MNSSLNEPRLYREQPISWTDDGWSEVDGVMWIDKQLLSTLRTRSDAFMLLSLGCDGFRDYTQLSMAEEWEARVHSEGKPCCDGENGCSGLETMEPIPHIVDPDLETYRKYWDSEIMGIKF